MNIQFKQIDSQVIEIINLIGSEEKKIGRIFTPSGSSNNNSSAIQICGFDEAFDLWGCGVFYNKHKRAKKDIQLYFDGDSSRNNNKYHSGGECECCYNSPCNCENKGDHSIICPFNVKRETTLILEKL